MAIIVGIALYGVCAGISYLFKKIRDGKLK